MQEAVEETDTEASEDWASDHEEEATNFIRMAAEQVSKAEGATPTPKMMLELITASGRKSWFYDTIPDSGAAKSVVGLEVLRNRNMGFERRSGIQMRAANNSKLRCPGIAHLKAKLPGLGKATVQIDAIVCENMGDQFLVGWKGLKKLRVLPKESCW